MTYGNKTNKLINILLKKKVKVCAAESITGGRFAFEIIKNENASKIFDYGLVTYSHESKSNILGLKDRGSLKPGCIADISIYDPNQNIDEMFRRAKYVFKNGDEVVKNGKVLKHKNTRTIAANIKFEKSIIKNVEIWSNRFYSLVMEEF